VRYSGVGLELAGATALLALVGHWVDGHYGTQPWGIVAGVIVGLVGGLYHLITESFAAVRDAQAEDKAHQHGRQ
jgi:F0F1-type ATP synthase assembly protein I